MKWEEKLVACKEYFKRRFGPKSLEEIVDEHGFGSCFSLFPAYYQRKHSPEKLAKMREEELKKLREMLEEFEKRINEKQDK